MNLEVWTRELSDESYAVAFVSQRVDGAPYPANFTLEEIQIPDQSYTVQVIWFRALKKGNSFFHRRTAANSGNMAVAKLK